MPIRRTRGSFVSSIWCTYLAASVVTEEEVATGREATAIFGDFHPTFRLCKISTKVYVKLITKWRTGMPAPNDVFQFNVQVEEAVCQTKVGTCQITHVLCESENMRCWWCCHHHWIIDQSFSLETHINTIIFPAIRCKLTSIYCTA